MNHQQLPHADGARRPLALVVAVAFIVGLLAVTTPATRAAPGETVAVVAPNTPQPIGAPFDVKINVTGDIGYKAYQYHLAFNFGGLTGDPPVIQAGPPVLDYVSNEDNGVLAQCTESHAAFPMGKQQSVFAGCGQLDLSTGDQSAFGDIATVTLVCAKDGAIRLHLVVGGEGTAVVTKLITSRQQHVEITTVDDTVTCGKGGDAQAAGTLTAQTASPGNSTPGRTVSAALATATATAGSSASGETSTESGGLNRWAVIAIAAVAGAAVLAIPATAYVRRRGRR